MSPNGLFVAVGVSQNGSVDNIGTSTDGLNWTAAANTGSLFSGGSGIGGFDIAYGAGTFVAVGISATTRLEDNIGISTDGLKWTVAANVGNLFSGGLGLGIAYGADTFVAVGFSPKGGVDQIGTSRDGLNWQVATNVGSLFSGVDGSGNGIAYGAGTFVAVGKSANGGVDNIGTSRDGLNWTVATNVGSLFNGVVGGDNGRGITYGLVNGVGTFVAVGGSTTGGVDNIGTSTDGLNWTVATSVGSLFSGGTGLGIAYGAGTFVAVGRSATGGVDNIGTSTDGLNWTVATNVGSLFSGGGGGYGIGIAYGLVNGVGTFVAVGRSATGGVDQIGTSTDGLNWTVAADVGSLFSGGGGIGIAYGEVTPTPTPVLQSNICFPAGTPIKTDQGEVAIEQLQPGKHTLGRQAIKHITQTITSDNYLIRIEKGAFGKNKPTKPTVMSKDHKIEYEGDLVPAYRFLDYVEGVKKVKYSGEILYNVLLEGYGTMSVNNLRCETLEPTSPIACVYRGVAYKKEIVAQGRFKTTF
jgi:carbon monoxide dehydrogenase subunit G